MNFRSTSYNAGRTFQADDFQAAAARVADHLARMRGGRRACAWTLREESTSPDRSCRRYSSTAGIPTKNPGECRVVGEHWFTVRSVGGAQ
jgi:hypothetical protein